MRRRCFRGWKATYGLGYCRGRRGPARILRLFPHRRERCSFPIGARDTRAEAAGGGAPRPRSVTARPGHGGSRACPPPSPTPARGVPDAPPFSSPPLASIRASRSHVLSPLTATLPAACSACTRRGERPAWGHEPRSSKLGAGEDKGAPAARDGCAGGDCPYRERLRIGPRWGGLPRGAPPPKFPLEASRPQPQMPLHGAPHPPSVPPWALSRPTPTPVQ